MSRNVSDVLHREIFDKINENFIIGVILAVSSSIFIGYSFILKKISLVKLGETSLSAGDGGFGYLKDWLWWSGMLAMGSGEMLNLIAYGYAPASVVTPLGALSILVSSVLASKYLKENLTKLGKVGCVLCIIGSAIIVANAPREVNAEGILTLNIFRRNPIEIYGVFVVVLTLILMFYLGPKYGHKYVLIYVVLCSLVGSITVMASTVLALAIRGEFEEEYVGYKIFLFTLLILLVCACFQINYLNKALDIFGPTVVTPIYYVLFTTLVLVSTAILFDEWKQMNVGNTLGTIFGLAIAFIAIFMLHSKEDEEGSDFLLKSGDSSRYS